MALTTEGISYQIASSLITFRNDGLGTSSDCKVTINHLIRKFSEPLKKENKQKEYASKNVISKTNTIKEHLLPVNEIMRYFLNDMLINKSKIELAAFIYSYLVNNLTIVYITKEEDNKLNEKGCQKNMPKGYFDIKNSLYKDIWARYKYSGIFDNINIQDNY